MAVEHRIVAVSGLSSADRESLLDSLRAEGWSPVFHHGGGTAWSRAFPEGFIVLERETPAADEPRWCAW